MAITFKNSTFFILNKFAFLIIGIEILARKKLDSFRENFTDIN